MALVWAQPHIFLEGEHSKMNYNSFYITLYIVAMILTTNLYRVCVSMLLLAYCRFENGRHWVRVHYFL